MKRFMQCGNAILVLLAMLALTSCKKNSGPGGGGGGGGTISVLMPASMSFYDGNVGPGTKWTYKYNADKQLIWYGEDGVLFREVAPTSALEHVIFGSFIGKNLYQYNVPGSSNLNIYDPIGKPSLVSVQRSTLNTVNNETVKPPVYEWAFTYNSAHQPVRDKTGVGTGVQVDYTYNDKNNLSMVEYRELDGPRSGEVYQRLTFSGYDDKIAPFAAVKGYRFASFPQDTPDRIVLAFGLNNPGQIKFETWSNAKNAFHASGTATFEYTYNQEGYATQMVSRMVSTPETGQTGGGTRTYNFTY